MEFKLLPLDVQIIAAQSLRDALRDNAVRESKKPAVELAQEVSMAFSRLFETPPAPQNCNVQVHIVGDKDSGIEFGQNT